MNNDMIKQAKQEYEELKQLVKQHKDTSLYLFSKLECFNYIQQDDNLMDLHYKSLTVTIKQTDKGLELSSYVEIWDDENGECITGYEMEPIRELAEQIASKFDDFNILGVYEFDEFVEMIENAIDTKNIQFLETELLETFLNIDMRTDIEDEIIEKLEEIIESIKVGQEVQDE